MVEARPSFRFVGLDGEHLYDLELPGNRAASPTTPTDTIYFAASYLCDPGELYRLDVRTGEYEVDWRPELRHDPDQFSMRQVFYRSQDGARIPMWIAGRKDVLARREPAPLHMYAYGALGWAAFPWVPAPPRRVDGARRTLRSARDPRRR